MNTNKIQHSADPSLSASLVVSRSRNNIKCGTDQLSIGESVVHGHRQIWPRKRNVAVRYPWYQEGMQEGMTRKQHRKSRSLDVLLGTYRLYDMMKLSRARFKYSLRFIKQHESQLRKDALANKLAQGKPD